VCLDIDTTAVYYSGLSLREFYVKVAEALNLFSPTRVFSLSLSLSLSHNPHNLQVSRFRDGTARQSPEGARFKFSAVTVVAGDGSAVKKERIKKRRLCNWASKGDISRVRQPTATHRRSRRGRTRTALALAVRVRYHVAGGVAFYERVGSIRGMMMVCLVTAAAEKRVALPRVISHTIMSTEGKTRMHYGCATRPHPPYVSPRPSPPGKSCHRVG